ncbi:MAG: flagellar hook-associated protein FlgL [Methylophilaceae bacterium]|nr:flagellar hook-associated protein FlgL [Methylophilaceae bacterium]
MRISTNTMYQSGISKISDMQASQVKLQTQISTGKRIQSPSDDPIASARALNTQQAQNINSQFASNRVETKSQLTAQESTLSNITELIVNTQANLVAAGNQAYSDTERGYMADDLNNAIDQLLSYANTRDADGNYMFSGNQTATQAFTKTATGATYQGDSGQRLVQVASDRQLAINTSGDNVFQGGGNDIFTTLTSLVTLLKTPVTNTATRTALTAGLTTLTGNLKSSLDNVLNIRADAGSKLNELDALDKAGDDRALQYAKNLADLQDLDYAKAVSDISQQKIILEAAQQTFVKTTGLTLFNYIN